MPYLQKHMAWLDENFKQENGLYSVPVVAGGMDNSPRGEVCYPVDFNACMAINAAHMAALGDILNDKELIFRRYPELTACKDDMYAAFEILKECVKTGGKILLCGNAMISCNVI